MQLSSIDSVKRTSIFFINFRADNAFKSIFNYFREQIKNHPNLSIF